MNNQVWSRSKRTKLTKKAKNKKIQNHVVERCKDRFNINISETDILNMIAQIKNNKSQIVSSQCNSRVAHKVKLRDMDVIVIYNSVRKIIHTVLPAEWEHDLCQRHRDEQKWRKEV